MKQYPKWLLALLAPSLLIPLLTMVFYLFGAMFILGITDSPSLIEWVGVVLLQLFWITPLCCFFLSLFLWGWMREFAAKVTAIIGLVISLFSVPLLFL